MRFQKSLPLATLSIGLLLALLLDQVRQSVSISAYWGPVLQQVCSTNVSPNVTRGLHSCDKMMDKQLATIFENCVYTVHRMPRGQKLDKPKLCYYTKLGLQLDRCKMLRYQSQGLTLPDLVEREQDHTWCLMKIAQPLGWERLCAETANDIAFVMARQKAIQTCETQYKEITQPIKQCFNETVNTGVGKQVLNWIKPKNLANRSERIRPAACLSFQHSRKIWKCLSEKDPRQSLQRRANLYLNCLRNIRKPTQVVRGPPLSQLTPPPPKPQGVAPSASANQQQQQQIASPLNVP